jgi:hypothetical protein
MERQQLIEWARETGFMLVTKPDPETGGWYECFDDELEAFAKLVAVHEREACANIADGYADNVGGYDTGASIAADIRARGNHA